METMKGANNSKAKGKREKEIKTNNEESKEAKGGALGKMEQDTNIDTGRGHREEAYWMKKGNS